MKKFIYRRIFITEYAAENQDLQTLFSIFKATLKPDMLFREFKAYYFSGSLHYIDATLVFAGNKVIGFCSAAFYKSTVNGRKYTIGRAATGILENYRGNALPKWKLYKKYIQYWMKNPHRNILLSAFVANPLIYSMICKYTGFSYPRPSADPSAKIVHIKDELLKSQRLQAKETDPFVVEIHFCVAISEREQERIFNSQSGAVKYFLKINPRFRQQYGVVVIIPVHLSNILFSSGKFIYYCLLLYFQLFLHLFQRKKYIAR